MSIVVAFVHLDNNGVPHIDLSETAVGKDVPEAVLKLGQWAGEIYAWWDTSLWDMPPRGNAFHQRLRASVPNGMVMLHKGRHKGRVGIPHLVELPRKYLDCEVV